MRVVRAGGLSRSASWAAAFVAFLAIAEASLPLNLSGEEKANDADGVCADGVCDEVVALQSSTKKRLSISNAVAAKDERKLTETLFLMTHDSATGYFGKDGLFTKVQETGFTGQLSCGARAFDLRLISMNGEAHFHHMPTQDGLLVPTTILDTTLESTIGEFINFANEHEDELLILYISHCAIAQKCVLNVCGTTDPLPCDNPNFERIYDDHKLFVVNHEKGCENGECLKDMSVGDAKQKATDQGQKGIIVVLEAIVDEHWDNNVKCGVLPVSCESEFDGPWNNYLTNYLKDKHNPEKLQILQAHWQGTAPEAKNRDFNQRVASENGPVMKNKDKLNLLQINFICDGGAEIAKNLGTNVDKCSC